MKQSSRCILIIFIFFLSIPQEIFAFPYILQLIPKPVLIHEIFILLLIMLIISLVFLLRHRQKSIRQFKERENQRDAILRATPDLIFRVSKDGTYLEFHSNDPSSLYIPEDQIIGNNLRSMFPDKADEFLHKTQLAIDSNIVQTSEYELKMHDGIRYYEARFMKCSSEEVIVLIRDFTDEKKVIYSLSESEEFGRAVTDNSPLGITIRNKNGQLLKYNKAWIDFWEVTDEKLDNYLNIERKTLNLDYRDNYLEAWKDEVKRVYNDGGTFHIPEVKVRAHGRECWLSHYFYGIKDSNNEVDRVVILTEDITIRKQYEKALEESEEKYRGIFDESVTAIYIFDNEKNFIDSNKAGLDLLGYPMEELLSLNISDVDADPVAVLPVHDQLLTGGRIADYEHRLICKDGQVITVLNNSRPLINSDGVIIGIQSTLIDITERKKAELALQKEQNTLNNIIELNPYAIGVFDKDGHYYSGNQAYLDLFKVLPPPGYSIFEDPIAKKTGFFDEMMAKLEKGETYNFPEMDYNTVDVDPNFPNNPICISTSMFPICGESGEIEFVVSMFQDVTERNNALKALKESEEKYRSLLNNIPIGVFRSSVEGLKNSLNPAMAKMYGYRSIEEMIASDYKDHYYDISEREEMIRSLHENGFVDNFEIQVKKKDGSLFWIESSLKATKDENGDILFFDGIDIDVTERKKAELAFQKEQKTLNKIIDLNPYAIGIFNKDGQFYRGNQAYKELFITFPPPAYNLFTDQILIDLGFVEKMKSNFDKGNSFNLPEIDYNSHDLNPEFPDNPICISTSLFTVHDNNGDIEFIVTMFQDVTERNNALKALKESEEKFRSLAENTSAAIFIILDNKLVYFNPVAVELSGYTHKEFSQLHIWDLIESGYQEMIKQKISNRFKGEKNIQSYEIPIITKSGKRKWVILTGGLVEFEGEMAILGTAFDITEKKKAEAQLKQFEQERYNQVKEIAGGIAHEIYNSLFPAVSSLDKLKQRIELNSSKDISRNQRLLELSDMSINRAISMTELVTEFSKLDVKKDTELIDLDSFIKTYLEEQQELLTAINIKKNISANSVIEIHRYHLYSLFHNIIKNAVDALENIEDKEISIVITKEINQLKIIIENNGTEIPSDIMDKIFNPFFSTKPKTGTGLGLAICKRIAENYNGKLRIETSIDKKTQFVILFKTDNSPNLN